MNGKGIVPRDAHDLEGVASVTPLARLHLGLALINPHLVYWALLGQSVQERATELGVRLSVVQYQSADAGAAGAEQLIHQRVDALIATTRPGENAIVETAKAAQVPVLVAGDPGEQVACDVYGDERAGAALIAEYLVQQIGGSGTVVELHGGNDVLERVGVLSRVLERFPDVQLGGSFNTDWSRDQARQQMHVALAREPALRGVFCHNDDIALGALDALDEVGRAGQVVVTGFDGTPNGLLEIRQHRLAATVYRSQRAVGRRAVELALDLAQGKPVPRQVRTEVMLVTVENVADAMLDAVALMPTLLRNVVESAAAQQRLQQDVITAQQALIQELSTPIIPITDRVLVVPLIGAIDIVRSQHITETVLDAITKMHARVVMLDVTGVAVVDTHVAQYLLQTTQAARLLGAEVVLVGITPEVAQTIVHLGISLAGIRTYSNVQRGLMAVIDDD